MRLEPAFATSSQISWQSNSLECGENLRVPEENQERIGGGRRGGGTIMNCMHRKHEHPKLRHRNGIGLVDCCQLNHQTQSFPLKNEHFLLFRRPWTSSRCFLTCNTNTSTNTTPHPIPPIPSHLPLTPTPKPIQHSSSKSSIFKEEVHHPHRWTIHKHKPICFGYGAQICV